jgi:hypothetical protein
MRSIGIASFILATALVTATTGCVSDDLDDDSADLGHVDEALSAGPSLVLSALVACRGEFLNVSGQITSSAASVTLTFNGLPIAHPGGSFSFNPGGSGTLAAKACIGNSCSSRKRAITWVSCHGQGGGEEP